jgi:transposase InsO family protein
MPQEIKQKRLWKTTLVSALRNKMLWECVHVDSNGPWRVTIKDPVTMREHKMEIHGLTMVSACTQRADATVLLITTAKHAAEKCDQVWLWFKPRPQVIIHNNGAELTGAEFQEMLSLYNIEAKLTTGKNPTANSLVEQIHLTLKDQLHTKLLGNNYIGEINYLL